MVDRLDTAGYDDPDEHRAQLIGWDREITLLEPGPLQLCWKQAVLGDIVVAEGWFGQAIADWSTVAAGRLNFVVCLGAPRPARWCGLEALPGSAIVGGSGRDFHAVQPAGICTLEFIVPEPFFPALRSVRGGPTAHDFSPRTCLMRLNSATMVKVTRLRRALFRDPVTTASAVIDPLWVDALRQQTLRLLSAIAAHIVRPVRPPTIRMISGYGVATRAILYIDQNAPFVDRVTEVADALGVSMRVLQQAFRSYVGINPHQYLLARKLHLARRQLGQISGIRAPVTDAAISSGFTHFGRFSAYYRSLFGETPRATLARAAFRLAAE
jgi:AraC-like DNA-binding protein